MGEDQQGRRTQGSDLTSGPFVDVTLIDPSLSHLGRSFTYARPDEVQAPLGSVVRVPFRGKERTGVVTGEPMESSAAETKPISAAVGPGLGQEVLGLSEWVSDRYLATLGEALATAAPKRVVSEETAERDPAPGSRAYDQPAPGWAGGYREGKALEAAVDGSGAGRIVLRPAAAEPRARLIRTLIESVLARGKTVIVLLPEVRATGDVARELRAAFGDDAAWLGSDKPARDRYRAWLRVARGEARVAMGGRGAVFAPIANLGAIIVDDEGNAAYKEGRAPRFHARTVAAERARRADATCILVGIPPSIEARAACEGHGFTLVEPPRDQELVARPPVTVITREPGERLTPTAGSLRIAATAIEAQQRVVILAHRGGATLADVAERSGRILRAGQPAVLDATTPKADRRAAVKGARVIIATPVIAKDLTIDGVGAVVIVDADAALTRPSFRAPEEVFATWWRTASWMARGRVALETTDPDHPVVAAFVRWDPEMLWEAEAERRRQLRYPPYAVLARVDVPPERGEEVAATLRQEVPGVEVLGPVEGEGGTAVVVLRCDRRSTLIEGLTPIADRWRAASEPMRIDIDPWEVLAKRWRS